MSATRQLCTFVVCDELCGLDVAVVQEILRAPPPTRVPLAPAAVAGLMNLRGQIVVAVDLRRRLGLPPREAGLVPTTVVVRGAGGLAGLLVDAAGDVAEAREEAFVPPPGTLDGAARALVRGAYRLAERLLLTLDLERVLDVPHDAPAAPPALAAPPGPPLEDPSC
jgi:purine-binding chemotaxis protein CheW